MCVVIQQTPSPGGGSRNPRGRREPTPTHRHFSNLSRGPIYHHLISQSESRDQAQRQSGKTGSSSSWEELASHASARMQVRGEQTDIFRNDHVDCLQTRHLCKALQHRVAFNHTDFIPRRISWNKVHITATTGETSKANSQVSTEGLQVIPLMEDSTRGPLIQLWCSLKGSPQGRHGTEGRSPDTGYRSLKLNLGSQSKLFQPSLTSLPSSANGDGRRQARGELKQKHLCPSRRLLKGPVLRGGDLETENQAQSPRRIWSAKQKW